MTKTKYAYLPVILLTLLSTAGGCKKESLNSGSLYTPTSADVTTNATLTELQQGRSLYVNNCNSCHGLYTPEDYTPSQWKSILASMAPKTRLTSTDIQLVTKYVSKGKQ